MYGLLQYNPVLTATRFEMCDRVDNLQSASLILFLSVT